MAEVWERYLVVGEEENHYSLVKECVWDRIPERLREDYACAGLIDAVFDAAMEELGIADAPWDERFAANDQFSEKDPDSIVVHFISAWEVHAFCQEHGLTVVKGTQL